jgi:hypothetical protein
VKSVFEDAQDNRCHSDGVYAGARCRAGTKL